MSDERYFQELLDEAPSDSAARWLFAEWLAERGDWRAAGYRWMAREGKYPQRTPSGGDITWDWWSATPSGDAGRRDPSHDHEHLTPALFELLEGYSYHSDWSNQVAYREYYTREDAEEALCRALYALQAGG